MRRKMTKSITGCLIFAMILGMNIDVMALAAKKASLSSKSLNLAVGKTKTIKVKNAKGKIKWTITSGKKYITMKKKNKSTVSIKGVKKGTAKVRAFVSTAPKLKLVCTVKVKKDSKKNTQASVTERPGSSSASPVSETVKPGGIITTNAPVMSEVPKTTNAPAISEEPKTTTSPAESQTPNPTGTNKPNTTDNPGQTETGDKNSADVAAIQAIIAEQRAAGAKVSENLDGGQYSWSDSGRLITVDWDSKSLTGKLDMSALTALETLMCESNQLTALDVSKNTALKNLWCDDNQLTVLDLSNNVALKQLLCEHNQLTILNVSKNTALEKLLCEYNQLTDLNMANNLALKVLSCGFNQLTELDVSKNAALTMLDCDINQLTALDVSNNTVLSLLNCHSNQITELDVKNNTALTQLNCSTNKLSVLDISRNTALEELDCSHNQLTTLDVSNNTALEELVCSDSQLTTLDVSKNTALVGLNCATNQLTSLDVSKNTELFSLYCYENQLTALDVNNNVKLEFLDCDANQLAVLDVSENAALVRLNCGKNQLTKLNISNFEKLEYLYCQSNELTELIANNNPELITLDCTDNKLTEIFVVWCGSLENIYVDDGVNVVSEEFANLTDEEKQARKRVLQLAKIENVKDKYGSSVMPHYNSMVGEEVSVSENNVLLDGMYIMKAEMDTQMDQGVERDVVKIYFTPSGSKLFAEITRDNINEIIAVISNGRLTCAPAIREEIVGGRCNIMIDDKFTYEMAEEMVKELQKY